MVKLEDELVQKVKVMDKEAERLAAETKEYLIKAKKYFNELEKSKQLEKTSHWQAQE